MKTENVLKQLRKMGVPTTLIEKYQQSAAAVPEVSTPRQGYLVRNIKFFRNLSAALRALLDSLGISPPSEDLINDIPEDFGCEPAIVGRSENLPGGTPRLSLPELPAIDQEPPQLVGGPAEETSPDYAVELWKDVPWKDS